MEKQKTSIDEAREEMQQFLQEEGFTETIRDDINYTIDNCGVQFGKYSMMRKEYLEENYWEVYFDLTCGEEKDFIEHFQDIDRRASEMYKRLIDSYLEKFGNEAVARSALEEFLIKEIVENTSFEEEVFNRPQQELTDEEITNLIF